MHEDERRGHRCIRRIRFVPEPWYAVRERGGENARTYIHTYTHKCAYTNINILYFCPNNSNKKKLSKVYVKESNI